MVRRIIIVLFIFISFSVVSQQNYLELREIVTDSALIFTPSQLNSLKQKLTDFETETTNQLVIVTVESLGYETIETYANGTFNQNGIGQEGKDNGILIVFSKLDRTVRIEVGFGLEPYITDAVASRIIRNTMVPNFKEERYFEGIDLATNQLMTFLKQPEALAEFKKEIADSDRKNKNMGIGILIGFLSIFVLVGGFFFFRSYSGLIEIFRGILVGKLGVLSGVFMLVSATLSVLFGLVFIIAPVIAGLAAYGYDLAPYEYLLEDYNWAILALVGFLLVTAIIALIKIKLFGKSDLKLSWLKNDKGYMRKTFSSTGTHSFGSSSSGGSSSSFSGGGGSSGGGGASGSW